MAVMGALLQSEWQNRVTWAPVFLMAGIWTYFNLSQEPDLRFVVGLAVACIALVLALRRLPAMLWIALWCIAGFVLADMRTAWVATPVLKKVERTIQIAGHVAKVERRGTGGVIILAITQMPALPTNQRPRKIRLSMPKSTEILRIGDHVTVLADVRPLPRPVQPGGFDYGRALFFDGIGATGRLREIKSRSDVIIPTAYRLRRAFHDLRVTIGARIRAVIPGANGAFADAIITGERAQIPKDMNDSLITSGLSHILSISGLHMSLVAGGVFWLVRALFALSPAAALHFPIKKFAAVAALVVGLVYMLLADGGAATERSYIMIALVFFAVLVGRPALSMHNLAIAALLILVTAPEQAIAASFQMSFLAVMGLAAFGEWWQRPREKEFKQIKHSRLQMLVRDGLKIAAVAIVTSLIAGSLTAIAAGYHFGRISPYGVMANALSLPVVSLIVMPSALFGTLLMPLGLETMPLRVLDFGLSMVMWISDWVASLPGAAGMVPLLPASSAALMALGAAIICLGVTQLRFFGVVPLLIGFLLSSGGNRPDVYIEQSGRNVGARAVDGTLVPFHGRVGKFAVERWLQGEGDKIGLQVAARRPGWTCDPQKCVTMVKGRSLVVLLKEAEAAKPCVAADFVIAQYPLRRSCKGKLATLDRFDLWRNGAYALTISDAGVNVVSARAAQGARPWVYDPRRW
jgi:competence protein ComEC